MIKLPTNRLASVPDILTRVARHRSTKPSETPAKVQIEGKTRCFRKKPNPQNLPLLPVPCINQTLSKYLYSIEPLVSECEMKTTKRLVKNFARCEGKRYQQYVVDRARRTLNWLREWYDDAAYLTNRQSLPIYSSPVVTFPHQKFKDECDMLGYAAALVMGAIKFKTLVFQDKLPTDTWGKDPLDMGEYYKIYGTTRMPGTTKDRLVMHPTSRYILVAYNNNFVKIEVMDSCGNSLSFNQVVRQLNQAVEIAKMRANPVGILTADRRDRWAANMKYMKKFSENEESLAAIEKALFVLCLDQAAPRDDAADSMPTAACRAGAEGNGSACNGANRWHDKTLQLFVGLDGHSGVIFEHAATETIPVAVLSDYVLDYVEADAWQREQPARDDAPRDAPAALNFLVTDELKLAMSEAAEHADAAARKLRVTTMNYDRYGMDWCKEMKVSADALVQIALQLAYYRLHDKPAAQHESVTTRKFYLGRNETVRSCTTSVVHFIKTLFSTASNCEKVETFRNAVKVHKLATYDAMNANGIDKHFFGLVMASKELGHPLPRIFRDVSYQRSSHFKIVSRQTPMLNNTFTCYGPGNCDGYGVCYNPRAENFNMCITSFCDGESNAPKLMEAWQSSMKNILEILCKSRGKRRKCV